MTVLGTSSRALLVAWLASAARCAPNSGLGNLDFDGAGGANGSTSTANGGHTADGGGGSGGTMCTVPANCPAASPCHVATCDQGRCGEDPVQDETPCQHGGGRVCHGGQCVECIKVLDCPDPGDDCKQNACNNDACKTTDKMNGSPCGNGLACSGGVCSGCSSPADCGSDTFCKTFSCTASTCSSMDQPDGTVTNMQTPGDCHVNKCVNGVSQAEVDDTDIPASGGTSCTTPCLNGVPNAPVTAGTMCSAGVCDGSGNCVQCLTDAQCTAPATCGGGVTPNACGCTNCNLGDGCADQTTCISGFCIDAVCCNNLCQGTCMACNVAGLEGTCSNIPVNGQDLLVCDDTHGHCGGGGYKCACDGAGKCKEKNGQDCFQDTDCASGNCHAVDICE